MGRKVSHKIFQGKLLLFGEQIINKGATGLAIPLDSYYGTFKTGELRDKAVRESNQALESLANYIIHTDTLAGMYDTNAFLQDIEKGMYFNSNIPMGYGLGSSGALVAAVYHQYRLHQKKNRPTAELKNELALLENHFHGKSSGLDALVCYLNKAVIIANNGVQAFELPGGQQAIMKVFLLNTRIARKTSPYVNLFLEKCKDKKFLAAVETSLIPANNIAVESFLNTRYADLWKSLKVISQVQLDLLPEFIPAKFHAAFKEGLKNNQFTLKICGAGGGGFIIGFAQNNAELPLLLPGLELIEVLQF